MLFYWTGALVWIAITFAFWWLVFEWLVGVANSLSYARWCVRHADKFKWHKHGHKLAWMVLAKSFGDFYAYRNRGNYTVTHQGNGAVWRGIGDWT